MIFTLEAVQADHGDALILHYGKNTAPNVLVIDGGPSGVYKKFLKPRLLEIKEALSPEDPLPLSMVMVSHLDDDHINGVLALTDEVVQQTTDGEAVSFAVDNIWVNTFDDIIGNIQIPILASIGTSSKAADLGAVSPLLSKLDHHVGAVIASTGQGRKLRDNAKTLSLTVNNPFKELKRGKARLVRGDGKDSVIDWGDGLKITVIHPNAERLIECQKKWDADLKLAKKKGDDSITVASLGDEDKSPFNLSSIVCLVEFKKKRILLTGDARSDDIMNGLKAQKLLSPDGKLHVDILKLPHHGSERNASDTFFENITADHYVISANGKHKNPDKSVLEKLAEVNKGNKGVTLYLTNNEGEFNLKKKIEAVLTKMKADKSKFTIISRKSTDKSIAINLIDGIDF